MPENSQVAPIGTTPVGNGEADAVKWSATQPAVPQQEGTPNAQGRTGAIATTPTALAYAGTSPEIWTQAKQGLLAALSGASQPMETYFTPSPSKTLAQQSPVTSRTWPGATQAHLARPAETLSRSTAQTGPRLLPWDQVDGLGESGVQGTPQQGSPRLGVPAVSSAASKSRAQVLRTHPDAYEPTLAPTMVSARAAGAPRLLRFAEVGVAFSNMPPVHLSAPGMSGLLSVPIMGGPSGYLPQQQGTVIIPGGLLFQVAKPMGLQPSVAEERFRDQVLSPTPLPLAPSVPPAGAPPGVTVICELEWLATGNPEYASTVEAVLHAGDGKPKLSGLRTNGNKLRLPAKAERPWQIHGRAGYHAEAPDVLEPAQFSDEFPIWKQSMACKLLASSPLSQTIRLDATA